jgi:hypothetical protein
LVEGKAAYFLCFFAQARRSTFFITACEHQIVYIVHSFLLALFVELIEGQKKCPAGLNAFKT